MTRRQSTLALASLCTSTWLLASCSSSHDTATPTATPQRTVLAPGQTVFFRNSSGAGKIESTGALRRRVSIDGHEPQEFEVYARTEEFLGRWGCQNGAFRWYFGDFRLGGASPRIVYDESELHFKTHAEARRKLAEHNQLLDWVGGENGLVVGFAVVPQRDQVNVDVYRYVIDGRPASGLSLRRGVWERQPAGP